MNFAFTKWKERATTSSSGRHLGYYKASIVSDCEEKNEELQLFSYAMLSAYNAIINSALALGTLLHR